jgi:hypothetical protein
MVINYSNIEPAPAIIEAKKFALTKFKRNVSCYYRHSNSYLIRANHHCTIKIGPKNNSTQINFT